MDKRDASGLTESGVGRCERIWTLTTPQDRSYIVVVAKRGPFEEDEWTWSITEVTAGRHDSWDGPSWSWSTALEAYEDAMCSLWSHEEEQDDA